MYTRDGDRSRGGSAQELALLAAAVFSAGTQISGWITFLPLALDRRADFTNLFDGASLVWSGHSTQIYGASLFNHAAYEAVVLAPLSVLGYRAAYLVFLGVNVMLLALAFRYLGLRWPLAAVAAAFVPVGVALMEGQDSVFTLFALVITTMLLGMGNAAQFGAGAMVGLTLYKPQIGLPIAMLMFLWQNWRFVLGYGASALGCLLLSIRAIGARGMASYVVLLATMSPSKYGIVSSDMVNLRGIFSMFLTGESLRTTIVIISGAVLLHAFYVGRRMGARDQMILAITTACLVSYHFLVSDLVIVLAALVPCLPRAREDRAVSWTALSLYAAPAIVALTGKGHFSLICLPLLAFHVALLRSIGAPLAAH